MVVFTFVRHGETDYNKNGILQGHLNIPLNNRGRQQAIEVGDKLSREHIPINLIISSDLDRTYETAYLIRQQLLNNNQLNIETTQLLRERNLGKLEGIDLRNLMHWEELPESKKAIEIQKLLNQKQQQHQQHSAAQQSTLQSQLNQLYMDQQAGNSNNNIINLSTPSSPSLSSTASYTSAAASTSSSIPSSPRSSTSTSLSSSTSNMSNYSSNSSFSSLSSSLEVPIPISLTSSSTPTNVKLSSNILKHLPQKELKMESKSKLIRRAKEAFQYILKQIPTKFINNNSNNDDEDVNPSSSSSSSSSSNNSNNSNNYHILIVSHSVILRTILSLLLCKKSAPLFCNLNGSNGNSDISQSEASSSQNFKWIQFELKNASTIRTSFSIFEKKSGSSSIKRIPREITFYPESSIGNGSSSGGSSNNLKIKSALNNTNTTLISSQQQPTLINTSNNNNSNSNILSPISTSSNNIIDKQQPQQQTQQQSVILIEKQQTQQSQTQQPNENDELIIKEGVVPSINISKLKEGDFFL